MKITTIGVDLAKEYFQIHATNEHGRVVQKKKLKRKEMATYFANLEPCLIGMEACGSSHYWAPLLTPSFDGQPTDRIAHPHFSAFQRQNRGISGLFHP